VLISDNCRNAYLIYKSEQNEIKNFEYKIERKIKLFKVDYDGSNLCIGYKNAIRIENVMNFKVVRKFNIDYKVDGMILLNFKLVVFNYRPKTILMWDLKTLNLIRTFQVEGIRGISCSKELLMINSYKKVYLYDTNRNKFIRHNDLEFDFIKKKITGFVKILGDRILLDSLLEDMMYIWDYGRNLYYRLENIYNFDFCLNLENGALLLINKSKRTWQLYS
jgi:hypothetical protein